MQAQWEHGERLQGKKNGRTLQTAVQCGMGRIEGSRGVRQNKEDERQHAGAELFENKKGKDERLESSRHGFHSLPPPPRNLPPRPETCSDAWSSMVRGLHCGFVRPPRVRGCKNARVDDVRLLLLASSLLQTLLCWFTTPPTRRAPLASEREAAAERRMGR
jgi:hypothetical protein